MLNPESDFHRTDEFIDGRSGGIIEWIEVSAIVVAAVAVVVGFLLSVVLRPTADTVVRSPLAGGHFWSHHDVAAIRNAGIRRPASNSTVALLPSSAPTN